MTQATTPTDPQPLPRAASPLATGAAQGLSLFFGLLWLINLLAQFRLAEVQYDPGYWWLNFYHLPKWIEQTVLFGEAIVLLAAAILPPVAIWRRRATRLAVELLWVLVGWNIINFYGGLARGTFHTSCPVPFPIFIALALFPIWRGAYAPLRARGYLPWLILGAIFLVAAVAFPILQMFCFGLVDHRKAAQERSTAMIGSAVIFPSNIQAEALRDRANLAGDLYRNHIAARVLIFTPTRDQKNGEDVSVKLRQLALAAGIPDRDIALRPSDFSIEALVNTANAAYSKEESLLLPIGDCSQLPEIDMLFSQAGRTTYPTPVPWHGSIGGVMLQVEKWWRANLGALRR